MAPKYALAVALAMSAAMICGTMANDVPVTFCAKDCSNTGVSGYQVQLSGCTDRPATCVTGSDGCCTISQSPDVIQYCYGSATYLCQWNILSGFQNNPIDPFIPDSQTIMQNGTTATPREYSKCMCNGSDSCAPVIYQPNTTTPYTVTFKPSSCGCSVEHMPASSDPSSGNTTAVPLRKMLK